MPALWNVQKSHSFCMLPLVFNVVGVADAETEGMLKPVKAVETGLVLPHLNKVREDSLRQGLNACSNRHLPKAAPVDKRVARKRHSSFLRGGAPDVHAGQQEEIVDQEEYERRNACDDAIRQDCGLPA